MPRLASIVSKKKAMARDVSKRVYESKAPEQTLEGRRKFMRDCVVAQLKESDSKEDRQEFDTAAVQYGNGSTGVPLLQQLFLGPSARLFSVAPIQKPEMEARTGLTYENLLIAIDRGLVIPTIYFRKDVDEEKYNVCEGMEGLLNRAIVPGESAELLALQDSDGTFQTERVASAEWFLNLFDSNSNAYAAARGKPVKKEFDSLLIDKMAEATALGDRMATLRLYNELVAKQIESDLSTWHDKEALQSVFNKFYALHDCHNGPISNAMGGTFNPTGRTLTGLNLLARDVVSEFTEELNVQTRRITQNVERRFHREIFDLASVSVQKIENLDSEAQLALLDAFSEPDIQDTKQTYAKAISTIEESVSEACKKGDYPQVDLTFVRTLAKELSKTYSRFGQVGGAMITIGGGVGSGVLFYLAASSVQLQSTEIGACLTGLSNAVGVLSGGALSKATSKFQSLVPAHIRVIYELFDPSQRKKA